MKSVQRKFGTFMKRSDNDADVGAVIADFKAVDDMLEKLIKDLKAWRDAWEDMLKLQYDTTEAFVDLYKPIDAPGEVVERRHQDAQTPAKYMQKALGLQKEYSDEKEDLAQEITLINNKLILPAEDAKQRTKLLQKTLKHRDNTKLDYERYVSRVEHARKKDNRTPKDEQNLQTQEASLAQSKINYQTADEHVKQTFPPVTAAVLSLLPHLMEHQIRLQTTLVGQLYTVLDGYTKTHGFPNPAPANNEITRVWDSEFTSFRKELESGIALIARGKAAHTTMNLPPEKEKGTVTGLGIRNKVMQRKDTKPTGMPGRTGTNSTQDSAEAVAEPEELAPPKPPRPGGSPSPSPSPISAGINPLSKPRIGSNSSLPSNGHYDQQRPPPPYDYKPTITAPTYPNQTTDPTAGSITPPSRYQTPTNGVATALSPLSNTGGGQDYYANRRPSQTSIASSAASIAAAKKKPPPPVPAKRMPSMQAQFVTALYDFEGQNPGDLAFREGDRIKVVKKTDSTDDWWDGELAGRSGAFPANYVQL